jgi:cell division protein FtsI/penicillin-binding protein 2
LLLLLLFGLALWEILKEPIVEPEIGTSESKRVLRLARPTRVCPNIVDRDGVRLRWNLKLGSSDDSRLGTCYSHPQALSLVMGGPHTEDGLVSQQRGCDLPETSPYLKLIGWQAWWVGPPPHIVSTIDSVLSARLYDLLRDGDLHGCIVLGTPDGEILACVQNPSGDLSSPDLDAAPAERSGIALWHAPWDWAVVPGSTMKVFVTAVARELGVLPPTVICDGRYEGLERPLECHRAHGKVSTFRRAVAASCNSYFFRLSENEAISDDNLLEFAEDSGLLAPKMAYASCNTSILAWTADSNSPERRALSFIGQEATCSPLALLSAYASLLGDGRPTWRLIRKMDGELVDYPEPESIWSDNTRRAARADLGEACRQGTLASSMRPVLQYDPEFKSGSGQVAGQGIDSWAVGRFAVGDRVYLLAVLVRDRQPGTPRGQNLAAEVMGIVADA